MNPHQVYWTKDNIKKGKERSTGCPKKNVAMFQTVITPSKMALGIKVGWVLKSSGSPLTDGHWNFSISTFGAWENEV